MDRDDVGKEAEESEKVQSKGNREWLGRAVQAKA